MLENIMCPRCGSEDLIDWGTDRRMCRNCHEVFIVGEDEGFNEEEALQSASERAEAFLEDMRQERLKESDQRLSEGGSEEQVPDILETESAEISIEGNDPQAIIETNPRSEEDATQEFERFYKELKAAQYEKDSQRASIPSLPQDAQPARKSSKKAIGWIVLIIVGWIAIMIICSLGSC